MLLVNGRPAVVFCLPSGLATNFPTRKGPSLANKFGLSMTGTRYISLRSFMCDRLLEEQQGDRPYRWSAVSLKGFTGGFCIYNCTFRSCKAGLPRTENVATESHSDHPCAESPANRPTVKEQGRGDDIPVVDHFCGGICLVKFDVCPFRPRTSQTVASQASNANDASGLLRACAEHSQAGAHAANRPSSTL